MLFMLLPKYFGSEGSVPLHGSLASSQIGCFNVGFKNICDSTNCEPGQLNTDFERASHAYSASMEQDSTGNGC